MAPLSSTPNSRSLVTVRRILPLLVCLAWGLFLLVPSVQAADGDQPATDAAAPTTPPTAAEIQAWIDQLDSDKFLLRENATQKLIEAKDTAIEPLTDAVRTGSLEKAFRCIHVLRAFAIGDDIATERAATAKLALIAATQHDRVSAYATDVLKKIQPVQRERAIRILSGLGVKFSTYSQPQGFQASLQEPGIVIDDSYQGTVDDLYYLQHLNFIGDVQISNDKVTADWFAHIAKMPNVRLMTIKDGPVDLEMLRELDPLLPRMIGFRLYYLDIKGSLAPLFSKMINLQRAELFGMVVDGKELFLNEAEQERIMRVVPDITRQVDNFKIRSGGFLGVHGSSSGGNGPCVIQNVNQDSGAYKAGLRGGDTMVEVDGEKVDSFTHLIQLLKDKKVGDRVEMIAVRGSETKKLDVTLGKWPLRPEY